MKIIQIRSLFIFNLLVLFALATIQSCNVSQIEMDSVKIFYDKTEPAIVFAAEEVKNTLEQKNISVKLSPLNKLPLKPKNNQVIISKSNNQVLNTLKESEGKDVNDLGEQAYAIRVTDDNGLKSYWAIGGDRVGAMYGGIHICEMIKAFGLDSVKNEDCKPYIAKRGIKFNIPLDERQPSHDDSGTAAQTNIVNMWDFDFWAEYLDVLARQRYNVLSLWNKHPFPSMVKLDDYPDVALDDVYNKEGLVKSMSIDEKIELWKKIMDYAYDRGIEVYIITWNIHMNGTRDKYGITEDQTNETTKDYLRKSVKQVFLTYPKLAGIGVTAGENMKGMSDAEREQWLWDTYGKGIQDMKKIQPNRHIRFIHRYWNMDDGSADFQILNRHFSQLSDGYDMSFKYARARIYSAYNPPFAKKELLPKLPENMSTWWNIRNDDIYNLRWGDPEYVKQFILHFPKGKKTAGYYMGSDRYAWGRESISKNPTSPRMLENEKHWYSFLLWGRLGYDPETSTDLLRGLLQHRFPEVSGKELYTAWQAASEVVPLVNKFHWYSWDYLWWPEAGTSTGFGDAIDGYHDIYDFIESPVMPSSGFIPIKDYVEAVLNKKQMNGTTPLEVADKLERAAQMALKYSANMADTRNTELAETLGDIKAMAYLGKYYASKIRGAVNLKLYMGSNEKRYKTKSIENLEKSLLNWQNYSGILAKQYIKMEIAMHGLFDWDKIEEEVKADIEKARNE